MSNLFDDAILIHSYTRAQAIADGVLVDVTGDARTVGYKVPVAMTAGAHEALVSPTDTHNGITAMEALRPFMVAGTMGKGALARPVAMVLGGAACTCVVRNMGDRVFVAFSRGADGDPVRAWAQCGPGDTAAPVITVMLEVED